MADVNISALPVITASTNDDYFIINDANSTTSIIDWEDLKASIDKLTGQITYDTGSEAAPSIAFDLDTDTGIYSPGLGQVSVVTNGDTRVYVDANGNVGIGNEIPSSFNSATNDVVIGAGLTDSGLTCYSASGSAGSVTFADGTAGGASIAGQISYYHVDDHLAFYTNAAEVARFTSDGKFGLGTTDPQEVLHVTNGSSGTTGTITGVSGLIVEAVAGTESAIQLHSSATDSSGIYFGDPGRLDAGFVKYDHNDDSFKIQVNGIPILNINSNGRLGLNTSATNQMLSLNGPATGDATLIGFEASSVIQGDVTTDFRYYKTAAETADATFTLTDLYHYSATEDAFGASSTVTNQYGFHVEAALTGATNNYAYYSALTGINNYAFYASGNANNYFNGNSFKVAVGGSDKFEVDNTGLVTIAETLKMEPGSTAERPTGEAGMFRYNSDEGSFEGHDGTSWAVFNRQGDTLVEMSATAPSNPNVGDIWYNTDLGNTYIYYFDGDSNQWVESSPSAAGGLFPDTVNSAAIVDLSVINSKYANNSISANKLQNGAVEPAKMSTGAPSWNTSGDTIISAAGQGLILTSPNGTQYRLTVDNSGNLSTTAV
ncbi:hypothetical protein [Synechococcus phage S-B68]|nr:hypothetical protein [Synechococcus phage S-B68]